MTVDDVVRIFAADGKGALSHARVLKLIKQRRIPAYMDKRTGQWVITEARVLPKKPRGSVAGGSEDE